MSPTIFVENSSGQLVSLSQQIYEAEADLQKLIAGHPDLLIGEAEREDRRYLLVRRESGVPGDGGANRWSLDHLFLDHEGVPTLVEVIETDVRFRKALLPAIQKLGTV